MYNAALQAAALQQLQYLSHLARNIVFAAEQ